MSDEKPKPCPDGDVMQLGPDLGGVRPFIRHKADHTIEGGMARIVKEGEPITCEAVRARPRPDGRFDVDELYTPPEESGGDKKGPTMVASDAYRRGWDNIFGNKSNVGQA